MAKGKPVFGGRTKFKSNFRKCLKADVVEQALNHGFEMKATKHNQGQWNEFRAFKFHRGEQILKTTMQLMQSDRPDWRQLWNDLSQELKTGENWGK
jgi:hypothetical protein